MQPRNCPHCEVTRIKSRKTVDKIVWWEKHGLFCTRNGDWKLEWNIYINGGDYYTKFITIVLRIFQQSFPVVRVSWKRWQDKPWMTKALKNSIKRKNKLYKAFLVHPGNSMHEKYRTYKNILRKCLKEAEIKYYEELFDNHKNSVYNLWKSLKS